MPRMAAMTRAEMYPRERITVIGSVPGGGPGAVGGVGSGRAAGGPADPEGFSELVIRCASPDASETSSARVADKWQCVRAEPLRRDDTAGRRKRGKHSGPSG